MPSGGGGASGDWIITHILDLIHIREGPYYETERFEAIPCTSSSGEGGTTTLEIPQPLQVQLQQDISGQPGDEPGDEPTPDLVSLWNAQSTVIAEQTERLDIIYVVLETKRDKLDNYTFDWGEIFLDALWETGIETILKKLWLLKDATIPDSLEFLIDYTIELIPNAVGYLKQLYRKCRSQIGAIKDENDQLLYNLPTTWDNYHLRLAVLKQHEQAIENMLDEIKSNEEPLKQVTTGDLSELIQAVKDLQYNGQRFLLKDGSVYELTGQTVSGAE